MYRKPVPKQTITSSPSSWRECRRPPSLPSLEPAQLSWTAGVSVRPTPSVNPTRGLVVLTLSGLRALGLMCWNLLSGEKGARIMGRVVNQMERFRLRMVERKRASVLLKSLLSKVCPAFFMCKFVVATKHKTTMIQQLES